MIHGAVVHTYPDSMEHRQTSEAVSLTDAPANGVVSFRWCAVDIHQREEGQWNSFWLFGGLSSSGALSLRFPLVAWQHCRTARYGVVNCSFYRGHTRSADPVNLCKPAPNACTQPLLSPRTHPNVLEHPDSELKRHRIPAAHPGERPGDPEVEGRVSRLALREGLAQPPQSVDSLARPLVSRVEGCWVIELAPWSSFLLNRPGSLEQRESLHLWLLRAHSCLVQPSTEHCLGF